MSTKQTPRTVITVALVAAAVVALGSVGAAWAQESPFEITPTVGYRWGGEIYKEDTPALNFDAQLADSSSYGIIFDIPVSYHVQIELSADHQSTGLQKDTLFVPTGQSFDLDVNYYHIGVLGQWPTHHVIPFVSGGLGVADLRPDSPGLSSASRFSMTIGGGIKVPVSRYVAFRLEARGYWTDTSSSDWEDHDHCDHEHDGCSGWHNHDLTQGQVKVGVAFRF